MELSKLKQRLEILWQEVERLEAESGGGGGGGGGTDNYNDLSNKPKINSVTLSGNKSSSDLGLASASDLAAKANASDVYTKSEVYNKSETYAKSEVYTKAEAVAAAAAEAMGAITDLDVPSIGGSTKYIKLVGQADGLVTAEAGNIDSSPTNASTNLVQSGGVYTAIQNIPSTEPTQILANSDLNSYLTPGNYYVLDGTTAATLSNTPFTASGFLLKVERTAGAVRFQTIIPANASGYYFTRLVRNSTTFKNWVRFDGTEIVPSAQTQGFNPSQLSLTNIEPETEDM